MSLQEQQLWRFISQLERELSEEPLKLRWRLPQLEMGPKKGAQKNAVQQDQTQIQETKIEETKQGKTEKKVVQMSTAAPLADLSRRHDPPKATYRAGDWKQSILHCQACSLGQEKTRIRQQAIVGYPEQTARIQLLLVCDAPSYEADQAQAPLDEPSLEYLRRWLEAIQLSESYFLTNLVKCRTPGNRAPWPEEVKACEHHLGKQLVHFQPKAILALGSSAARSLSQQRSDLNTLREANLFYTTEGMKIPLFVTYSVGEVLQNPSELRAPVWQDLKRLHAFLQG